MSISTIPCVTRLHRPYVSWIDYEAHKKDKTINKGIPKWYQKYMNLFNSYAIHTTQELLDRFPK